MQVFEAGRTQDPEGFTEYFGNPLDNRISISRCMHEAVDELPEELLDEAPHKLNCFEPPRTQLTTLVFLTH